MPDTLLISELFGPTFQGEGNHVGMPCMFLRLAGCNLACSWCDTKYAWDWKHYDIQVETTTRTIQDVFEQLEGASVRHLVITGGEPMLQQRPLTALTTLLHKAGWSTEMETAGTIVPQSWGMVNQFNVSPKLANSGNPLHKRQKADPLQWFADCGKAVFKYVVVSPDDFKEIDSQVERFDFDPVYIMPEGIETTVLQSRLQQIARLTIERGYHIGSRLHIEVYGVKRGV